MIYFTTSSQVLCCVLKPGIHLTSLGRGMPWRRKEASTPQFTTLRQRQCLSGVHSITGKGSIKYCVGTMVHRILDGVCRILDGVCRILNGARRILEGLRRILDKVLRIWLNIPKKDFHCSVRRPGEAVDSRVASDWVPCDFQVSLVAPSVVKS